MFGGHYFGHDYFGERYFGNANPSTPVTPEVSVSDYFGNTYFGPYYFGYGYFSPFEGTPQPGLGNTGMLASRLTRRAMSRKRRR